MAWCKSGKRWFWCDIYGVSERSFPVVPLLSHGCTQVYRFSEPNPAGPAYLCETDVSKYV